MRYFSMMLVKLHKLPSLGNGITYSGLIIDLCPVYDLADSSSSTFKSFVVRWDSLGTDDLDICSRLPLDLSNKPS